MRLTIAYRDFCDVPRMFVVERGGLTYLFLCPFHAETDAFPECYDVYGLACSKADVDGVLDWTDLAERGLHLGRVAVTTVEFDITLRETIDADVLSLLTR